MAEYDVLIIGGGPTGLSAAITTAKKGLSTLVIEEHLEIGYPLACGEGISSDKLLSLENMPKPDVQVEESVLKLQKHESFIERVINAQRFYFGSSGVATAHLNTFTINRPMFDKSMAKEAHEKGVEIILGTQVVGIDRENNKLLVKSTNGSFRSKIVIGCDGPSAHSVRFMGLKPPREYVQGVEYKIEGVHTDALDFYFDFKHFPSMHYGWVFPKKNHTNIGVVVNLASKPKIILEKFLAHLKDYNIEKRDVLQKIAGIIPASGPIPKTYCNNFMVAGDAAGLTNSIFYGGISIGIHSGMIAGQTAVKAHEVGQFGEKKLSSYQERCQSYPYSDPIIQQAHNILYNQFSASEIEIFGSWIDGWDITQLSGFQKLRLFAKALVKPSMLKKFGEARVIAHAFSKSRDWGF
ncbi:MAG: NAD(P)/FAD-dependent oxidoreductase [Candidatus Hodarchaeales archaeon]|jgi:geranylgeranyl reductase family protein